jgi:hypothetical protein
MIKKEEKKKIQLCIFSYISGLQNPGSGLDPDSLEMQDPDPYPHSDPMNQDPKHWIQILKTYPREY